MAETEDVISVDMIGDAEQEAGETFTLNISISYNVVATATAGAITGTIANDDMTCDASFIKDSNLFNLARHLVGAQYYRDLRGSAFKEWALVAV